ncbi:MAG: SNARE-binding exocyst subunit S6 [Watsoniomyces obsoletus]|nr:MAG: SNARE-binding exocyst subunit S6 [Watsoniomyces obsoletus]
MAYFRITLIRSAIGLPKRTNAVLDALGLRKRMRTVYHPVTPDIAGQILKVKELVAVSEVDRALSIQEQRERRRPDPGLRNVVFALFILRCSRATWRQLSLRGVIGTLQDVVLAVRRTLYGVVLRAPGVRSQVQNQIAASITKIEAKLIPQGPGVTRYLTLPKEGWSESQVRAELDKLAEMDHTKWEEGYVSGAVYHGGKELTTLQTEAYGKFAVANPLHPDVFPGVRKMEAEVVAMVLALFHAPPDAAGLTTSGGTESILMACYGARQKAYTERGITKPEMILPETAHTAFHKACAYFNIHMHIIPCPAPDYKVSIPIVKQLINSNTILIVGSAPNFPHGIIDDIPSLSQLAFHKNIPLHVDCCLGSFIIAFLERAGFESTAFDFQVPGVTSISCDTHKYGFAPKGNSTLLYRTKDLRAYQYFFSPNWTGGVYASPSMAGSRPGALIAACWASLMSQGESGYLESCRTIIKATKRIESAIRESPTLSADLSVIGRPIVSVVAFTSLTLDIYDIADAMGAKGWHLNALQNPPAIHIAVTIPTAAATDRLLADLTDVVATEREKERMRVAEGRSKKGAAKGDTAALYGVAGSLPNKTVVVELAKGFLDTLYKA